MRRCALLLSVLALLLPTPAFAGGFDTYVTTVTGVTPALAGIVVSSPSNGEQITLTNPTDTPLVIEGYSHEPYLKVSKDGVWQNKLSPAVYLNKVATIDAVPQDANAQATPVWVKLNSTDHAQWHDHRIHWMGTVNPPSVQADPKHAHLIKDWTIPIVYGSQKAEIAGTLTYEPGSSIGTYLTYGAIGLAVVAILVLQIVILRRRRTAPPAPPETPEAPGTPAA